MLLSSWVSWLGCATKIAAMKIGDLYFWGIPQYRVQVSGPVVKVPHPSPETGHSVGEVVLVQVLDGPLAGDYRMADLRDLEPVT